MKTHPLVSLLISFSHKVVPFPSLRVNTSPHTSQLFGNIPHGVLWIHSSDLWTLIVTKPKECRERPLGCVGVLASLPLSSALLPRVLGYVGPHLSVKPLLVDLSLVLERSLLLGRHCLEKNHVTHITPLAQKLPPKLVSPYKLKFFFLTFHLWAQLLENSVKATAWSGWRFFNSSLHACTKYAYAVILPLGFPGTLFLGILSFFFSHCLKIPQ